MQFDRLTRRERFDLDHAGFKRMLVPAVLPMPHRMSGSQCLPGIDRDAFALLGVVDD